ncbi:ATP synthase F1 subunit gamma [Candidatus Roizmanbacteria bacterium CG22_combo_CG10-13_8_21_14_all_38_20]|uniref:ATP synthase gamma chain n=1 Tax=Candidatus Roizmanbacteria bacterium CG22_combo_CG10-13_8_21_14_all_38_20 TaxID=1974862 RepID=A0A2H0BWD5_9BACT|nr:ATP synthase F1 subunit gamma [Candidatus Microgenomates bacterium]PIP61370.1 MAG: ATP synthase F1 subunit gamma [Candidatus Roizmanbacteria bacterium CG22_combo_CG10-13_8_21_14_all_38_20]PJC31480.1 MAG: ATP synthase F1 subunit gamma [Candidatus Roizmanbacteria bacterium CG_4_9_14_0_2_um_filter_38_17]
MATLREIKRRVKSVKNISQITSAMQMVAASKMKKAQQKATGFEPYAQRISEAVKELASGVDSDLHSLLSTGNPEARELVIIISTNKGLCGGLNSGLFRAVKKWYLNLDKNECVTVGKKGQSFVRSNRAKLVADFSDGSPINSVSALAHYGVEGFLRGDYSKIVVVYNKFVNSFTQEPTRFELLPITSLGEIKERLADENKFADFLVEPNPVKVLDALLPEYVENIIRAATLSAEASEYSARMMAMKNATDNADELQVNLTLEYNKMRQSEITTSLQDMITARMTTV